MTKMLTYACPGTAAHPPHQFRHLHHPSVEADPAPRFCPVCGYDSAGEELPQALTMPHIGRPVRGSVDGLHRAMEEGANFRAQMAQEQFGLDADEAATMKMTDMKDNLRQGDTSNVEVNNEVSRMIAAAPPGVVGFSGGAANGLAYSATVGSGPFPNAGAHAQAAVRRYHAAATAGSGMAGPAVSDLPALETQQPGYRRRV